MKKNKDWFSLVIAMWIVIVISLLAYNILEYIMPFSKQVKWIENSSKSYYLANSWIEEWLYHIKTRTVSNERLENTDNNTFTTGKNIDYKYNTFSSGTVLPPLWEWNSLYDDDTSSATESWNTISQWSPIQLSIWNWYITSMGDFKIAFRTPNLDKYDPLNNNNIETISWSNFSPYTPLVNWQLSSNNNSLNASWGIITNNKIIDSDKSYSDWKIALGDLLWTDLNWNDNIKISDFYSSNCWSWSWCILKFSIINKLELDSWNIPVPYLEWRINTTVVSDSTKNKIPLRYTRISSVWKAIWYKKELEIKVPTKTLNQAFDFTIFQ